MNNEQPKSIADLQELIGEPPSQKDEQINQLQEQLAYERDARREDRFIFIITVVLLLDVVFFSVMDSFGGPLALLVIELMILIPLAKRMGMEELAVIFYNVLGRITGSIKDNSE
jgi:hypothetical protein